MKAFGKLVNPDLEQTPVPVGTICLHCEEPIEEGDSGVWLNNDTVPEHIECFMRSIIGSVAHQRRQCSCFGGNETEDMPGFSTHQAAIAAYNEYQWQQLRRGQSSFIRCPKCGRVSHNINDVLNRYCGHCHQFHDQMKQ